MAESRRRLRTRGWWLLCLLAVTSFVAEDAVAQLDLPKDEPASVKAGPDDSTESLPDQQDDSGTLGGYDLTWKGLRHLQRIQFLANISTLNSSPTFLPRRETDVTLDWWKPQPTPLGRSEIDPLLGSPLSPIMSPVRNLESYLTDTTGLNFGIYYTLLYQHVTDPVADRPRDLGTGRLDVNVVWNLWQSPGNGSGHGHTHGPGGPSHDGHGLIGVLVRQGQQIGVPQNRTTRDSVGSTQGLNSLYQGPDGGPATLNLLYYQQGILDDRIVVSAGKLHPNQYIGLNFWANDESRQFLAGPFDGIQTLGSGQGGYQLGVAGQAVLGDEVFMNAIVVDALGTPQTMFSTLSDGYVWSAAEVGWLLPVDEERFGGPSALSLIWAGSNLDELTTPGRRERRWSNGLALQFQGHLTSDLGVWAQGGVAAKTFSETTAEVSVGLGYESPFGRRGDLIGLAYNWSKPSKLLATERSQNLVEAFYRIQLTGSLQLSPDIQVVFDPGDRPGSETVFVFGLRLTTDF